MPVSVLLCEGEDSSFDALVLRAVLRGIPLEVKPSGGKHGFEQRIKLRREVQKTNSIFGIRDRDYDVHSEWVPGETEAFRWTEGKKSLHLGWCWRRTDIESYLTCPSIIASVFADTDLAKTYAKEYESALKALCPYLACRIALGQSRKGSRLPSKFGKASKDILGHCLPSDLTETALEGEVKSLIEEHNNMGIVVLEDVMQLRDEAHKQLVAATPEACRDWLSGKDLVLHLSGWLKEAGFQSPSKFLAEVAKRIKNFPGDAWSLLPEWESLRRQVEGVK